jgi:LmbE family N-acetylglucosaminyl deacetylase
MKPSPKSSPDPSASTAKPAPAPLDSFSSPLLAFGAHPDDIEFGCGGVIAREARAGRPVHFVICSRGEAGTNGTPAERTAEAEKAAAILGATLEFVDLDGDAHLEVRAAHAIRLAAIIRRIRPVVVLAPSLAPNQHPDHPRMGTLVRDAARLSRYGGLRELRDAPPHAIGQLFFFASTPDSEPRDLAPVLIDISAPEVLAAWTSSMEAHASQMRTRGYVELQITRARLLGLNAGVGHAMQLFPNDAPVFDSLAPLTRGARHF